MNGVQKSKSVVIENELSSLDEKEMRGEMGQKYVAARGQIKQGKLIRQNIIDIVDFIVRRKNINPSNKSVLINFVISNLNCCKRILIRDREGRK